MNRTQLIGRLGRAPELRETARGPVATFNMAMNEYWKDLESGEMRSHIEWHTCACFDRLALVARDCLHKGRRGLPRREGAQVRLGIYCSGLLRRAIKAP